jgi:hypothetical protein
MTSVFLHVLVLKDRGTPIINPETGKEEALDEITSTMLNKGEALYGVVNLVKYDKIPKHFRQRYLLSDFGLVGVSADEGTVVR